MRTKAVLLAACMLLLPLTAQAQDHATSLGFRQDTRIVEDDGEFCPGAELLSPDDGDFENGYCWRTGGVVPPDYGSFAECHDSQFVCGVQFLFTQTGYYIGQTMDVYVWGFDDGGDPPPGPDPGNVICVVRDVSPGPIAYWPSASTHNVQVCCETDGFHFAGYWGNWPGHSCGWFIASDEDGPGGGCPRTKIAPGIGYDTGWQPLSAVPTFAGCRGMAIREFAGLGDCQPTPAGETTWGRIKSLYRSSL